jgi:tetratricopeptide (TPR) repeat protein
MADYNRALQMRPNYPQALNNRGVVSMRKGEFQRAIDDFNASLKYINGPNRYYPYFNRGHALTLKRDYRAALADFAQARQLKPAGLEAPNFRCITYTEMGRFDEAIADCNEVLAKFPKSPYTLTSRANAQLARGDQTAAMEDYNSVLQINPNYVRAYAGRAALHEKRGDLERARADYRAASAALSKFDDIETAIARRQARERLEALVAAAPPAGKPAAPVASSGPRRVALIIGNGTYKHAEKLDNPPRDAKLIAATFRELGFHAVTLASDLTRDKFFAALHEFGLEAEKAEWAVVYYAGHGMEIGGVNFLIPTDARLAADQDAPTQAVALEQVIAAVSGARKLRLIMLDACRDNPFEKKMQRSIALKLVDRGLSNIEPEAGFMVVYAAKHGETALDGDSVNSPFATALARGIKEPRIEVRKLFDIVRDDVWAATKRQQQPFTYGSLPGREDFYFVAEK